MVGKVLYIKYKEIVDGQIVEKVRYAVDRWQADDKYMGESFITFTVKSPKPISFSVGDYCEYRGETYTLNYIPSVSQRANIGGSGEAFVYEQVKMDSPREELDRAIMLDVTSTTGDYIAALGTNYTGSAQFQLYCGETTANGRTLTPVCALAAKMQANLDRAFPDKGWKVLVDTTSTHEEAGQQVLNTHSDEKTLTFDNTTIANALAEVKNTFEIDFAVKGRTIYIGYTFGAITGNDDGDYCYFGYGKGYLSEDNQGKALFELKRTSDSGQKIVTRLRALGSTKNMPYRYYNKKYNLSQSLFPMNLQLPDTFETPEVKAKHNKERKAVYPWIRDVLGDTNDAYIDKNDNCLDTVEGLREDCMRWDGTNADLKEIYPSIEEVTYGELRAALCEDQDGNKGSSAFPHYGDNERVDEILGIDADTNVGDGILTESDSTRQTAFDTDVRLSSSETASSLVYMGSGYISKEKEVMNISSQYAGNYIISNSHLWFRASYSLGRHQSENITKTCKVAYQIKVYAKDLGTNKESVICTYISDYKQISNREAKEYEVEVAKLPDVDAEVQKVDKITVTNPSDIRITFALIVKDIDYSYDQWNVNWNLGLSFYENPDTDTEWTPSLIWDLEGSASTFMKNPFHVYVKDMGFDFVAAFGTSDTPTIAMKSGMCVAREFTIGNNPQKVEYTKDGITYKAWRLTLAKADDPSLKTYYPSENFPLAAGDNFVIIGIEMPDVYIQAASMKLLVEATKALSDVCDTKHEYEPSVDDIYIQRNYDRCEEQGDVTKSVYWKLGAGMKFPFFGIAEEGKETPDMFSMIIDTLSIREGEGLTPKISIKLSEDFQQSTLQKLTRTVTSITNGSIFKATSIGNGGGLDESSVRAIVSEFTKSRYLSKLNPDNARGIITFLQGLVSKGKVRAEEGVVIGQFVQGFLGTGGSVDAKGNAEFESIFARSFISTPELRYNRIAVTDGELWITNGNGIIESIDTENMIITLHLEENDFASVAEGDLCRGIYNNFGTTSEYQNFVTLDTDDCGFPVKAGFFTSYFRVAEILEQSKGKCSFRYELRNSSTPHPCAQMKFAQYGNDIDETRQASAFISSVGHFYFESMEHVNTWAIQQENITIRWGWVDGFPVKNTDGTTSLLRNYGLYVPDNIYFGNAVVQLDPKTIDSLRKEMEQYSIELSNYTDVITVDDAGNVIDGLYKLAVEGDLTTKYDYRIAPAVFVKKGNEYLVEADSGDDAAEGTYKMYVTPKNCTAEIINGTVCVTAIDNIKDGVSGTDDDVDFDYDAMRKMESISVVISVICEGKGSITKEFKVAIKHDSVPYIDFSLSNTNTSVAWNTKSGKYIGLPYSFKVFAHKGSDALPMPEVELSKVEGANITFANTITEDGYTRVTIEGLSDVTTSTVRATFTASVKYAGVSYESNLVHTINVYQDVNVYDLRPSVTQVVMNSEIDGSHTPSVDYVTCRVLCNSSEDEPYYLSEAQMEALSASVKFSKSGDDNLYDYDLSPEEGTPEGVAVTDGLTGITFYLYIGGEVYDTQDVSVMYHGEKGDDAVTYSIESSTYNLVVDGEGTLLTTGDVTISAYKQVGSSVKQPVKSALAFRGVTGTEETLISGNIAGVESFSINASKLIEYDSIKCYSIVDNTTSICTITITRHGEKGDKGESAYEITMSNLNLTYNSRKGNIDGNYPTSQLEVNIQCSKGGTPLRYTNGTADDWVCSTLTENKTDPIIEGVIWAFKVSDDGYTFSYIIYCKTTNKVDIEIPFTVTAGGLPRQYKIHLQSYEDGGTPLNRGIWSAEGYIDENGEATNGYFYRYKNDTLIRDLVAYKIGGIYYYYMVKDFTGDTPVTEAPATAVTTEVPVEIIDEETGETTTSVSEKVTYQTSDKWEQMSKVKTIFSEVIYADDATIGGFHINQDSLWAGGSTPKDATVLLDGKNGTAKVTGEVHATSGSFDNCTIGETCEVGGRLKGVTGTFKKITSLDENGDEATSLVFGGQRLTFDGHINQQGTTSDGNSLRFYSAHIWCRGSFGAYQLNTVIVEGNTAKYYYDGLHKSKYYEYKMASVVINNKTCYKLPLYSPGTGSEVAGFPVDMVLFRNSNSAQYYMFTDAVVGKMVHCINIADDYNDTFILGNSGYTQCGGGVAQTWFYAGGSNINPANANNGGGWLIMTQYDNNW